MPWLKPLQTQMFLFCALRFEQLWRTSAAGCSDWCFVHWRWACSILGTQIKYYLQLSRFIDVPDIINNWKLQFKWACLSVVSLYFELLVFSQKIVLDCHSCCTAFLYRLIKKKWINLQIFSAILLKNIIVLQIQFARIFRIFLKIYTILFK